MGVAATAAAQPPAEHNGREDVSAAWLARACVAVCWNRQYDAANTCTKTGTVCLAPCALLWSIHRLFVLMHVRALH